MDTDLKNFYFNRYTLVLRVKEQISLPVYKGATLRGGFGLSFRRMCCITKNENCLNCSLKNTCVYAYVFETSPFPQATKLSNLQEIPRPFVIEPPLENKQIYQKDECIKFTIVLIGKAIDYLPYFILAFEELGAMGIGRKRGRFVLTSVTDDLGVLIYDEEKKIKNISSKMDIDTIAKNCAAAGAENITVSFLSPTRIKYKHDLVVKPEFHVLLRALLHRLSALAYFHCGHELDIDYNSLISQSERIKIKESKLHWMDWERYSSRQDTRMKFGGFVGEVNYEGNFKMFPPLLLLGQYIHVGKNCTFGLGKYEIHSDEEREDG